MAKVNITKKIENIIKDLNELKKSLDVLDTKTQRTYSQKVDKKKYKVEKGTTTGYCMTCKKSRRMLEVFAKRTRTNSFVAHGTCKKCEGKICVAIRKDRVIGQ